MTAISCSPNIFKQFEEGCNSSVTPDEEGLKFIYEVLAYHDTTAVFELHMPNLEDEVLKDWEKFENWCDEINHGLMYSLISEDHFEKNDDKTPEQYFGSRTSIKEKVIRELTKLVTLGSPTIGSPLFGEIECENKRLFLIFHDSDGWALGHCDNVFVVKSLEDLTPERGYYPLAKRA